MTVYALGDYHGESIQKFLDAESPTSEDTVLSTGDFDQVNVVHEILDLKDRIGEESFIDVGGNHDHALLEKNTYYIRHYRITVKTFSRDGR